MEWFAVDKEGLAALLERKGKAHLIYELVQNAWDEEGVRNVTVSLTACDGRRGRSLLVVEDDAPEGFADLTHAFTLFAPSKKKSDATKRGRWNLGEKLILAMVDEAEITSTSGGYRFSPEGRSSIRSRRPAGSQFAATVRMTAAEREEAIEALFTLLPPPGVRTTVNGVPIPEREPETEFTASLRTEVADEDGVLRPTRRQTTVRLHRPLPGESPHLYEMGIAVVELTDGMPWHVDVQQKIPLDFERTNVTPAYAKDLRVAVLNAAADRITPEDAVTVWVKDAAADSRASDQAIQKVIHERWGDKVVSYDPSDPEANAEAVIQGYTVVSGGSLSKAEWEQVRRSGAIKPAGQVTPSNSTVRTSEDGTPPIERADWTAGMEHVADYASRLAQALLGRSIAVDIHRSMQGFAAAYSPGHLMFNLQRLGHAWFNQPDQAKVDALLIHEFAHERVSNHLSEDFHEEVCRLGAELRNVTERL